MKVICGGMYRSGGTWQYNVIRLIMLNAGLPDLRVGWAHDEARTADIMGGQNCVLKSHNFRKEFLAGDIILTSFRDLRDVVASMNRKFKSAQHLHTATDAFDRFKEFLPFATYAMKYEKMMEDPRAEIEHLGRILQIPVDVEGVFAEVSNMRFREARQSGSNIIDAENLLHPNHITDGRHGSWRDQLPVDVVKDIEKHFKDWMIINGYMERDKYEDLLDQ